MSSGEIPGVRDRAGVARLHLAGGNSSADDYAILRDGSPGFAGIAAEGRGTFALRADGLAPVNVEGAFVSGNYFEVLGTRAHAGRLLDPADDRPDAPLAVVISHGFWTTRLGAQPDITGKTIVIGGRPAVVVGVAQEGFPGLRGGDIGGTGFAVYVPLAHARDWPGGRSPAQRWLNVYGRLTGPMNQERLEAELLPIAARIHAGTPITRERPYIAVTEPWRTPAQSDAMLVFLYLAMLAVPVTVLAIGSANVANLQLVRASLRTRELAMRASLGASRGQIVRLLTLEATVLVAASFATAAAGIWVLLRVAALVIPVDVTIDTRVLLFSAALAVMVIGVTGLLPGLLATRMDVSAHLRSGGRSMASGNSRVRRGLVVAQVTMCFLILLVSGFFIRGFSSTLAGLPAHAPHTLITQLRFDVLPRYGAGERRAFVEAFEARLRADGRVRAIGYNSFTPSTTSIVRAWPSGDASDTGRPAEVTRVAGDYFETSGLRLTRGRPLTSQDAATATSVVVNQAFVTEFELKEPVVGQAIKMSLTPGDPSTARFVTIVGVAAPMETPADDLSDPVVYLPFDTPLASITASIRVDNAAQMVDTIRRILTDLDPELPVVAVETLETQTLRANELQRTVAKTAGSLGAIALLLAVSGLYSVIAFFVALRTNEFGIRVALGARSADIVRMVLGQALRLASLGLAVGAVLGIPLLIGLNANFPFTTLFDPVVILPPALALALTALLAGWIPARRASSFQASEALRAE